jgi:WW domain-containing oxidoreductase
MDPSPQTGNLAALNGTVLITGANGSLGLEFVRNLLLKYPSHFAVLTVRNDSINDPNTTKLRDLISSFKNSNCSIEVVDLASLSSVRSFADSVNKRVLLQKLPPISAIVCNAFNWSLKEQQNSLDGFDLSFQVSHLSHFVLVLKLLGSVDKTNGRIVFLGSDAHDKNATNSLRPLGAEIPDNIEELVRPTADKPGEEQARGFQRYGNAKLANIMFMYMLNRKLLLVSRNSILRTLALFVICH